MRLYGVSCTVSGQKTSFSRDTSDPCSSSIQSHWRHGSAPGNVAAEEQRPRRLEGKMDLPQPAAHEQHRLLGCQMLPSWCHSCDGHASSPGTTLHVEGQVARTLRRDHDLGSNALPIRSVSALIAPNNATTRRRLRRFRTRSGPHRRGCRSGHPGPGSERQSRHPQATRTRRR